MKRRAIDKDSRLMIGINTWLFGVGAVLVAAHFISELGSLSELTLSSIFAFSFSQVTQLSTFAILMAGCFYSLVIIRPDVARRRREKEMLKLEVEAAEEKSFVDSFTGLYNHHFFERSLNTHLQEARATDVGIGLLLIQLENLRDFSNVDGKNLEDEIIKAIGNNLLDTARDYDVIARVGIKKFAVLTTKIQENDLISISNRFGKVIAATRLNEAHAPVEFNVGFGFYKRQSAEEFMVSTNQHLKIVKRLSHENNVAKLTAA